MNFTVNTFLKDVFFKERFDWTILQTKKLKTHVIDIKESVLTRPAEKKPLKIFEIQNFAHCLVSMCSSVF